VPPARLLTRPFLGPPLPGFITFFFLCFALVLPIVCCSRGGRRVCFVEFCTRLPKPTWCQRRSRSTKLTKVDRSINKGTLYMFRKRSMSFNVPVDCRASYRSPFASALRQVPTRPQASHCSTEPVQNCHVTSLVALIWTPIFKPYISCSPGMHVWSRCKPR
jgi:hypothetical protein